MHMKTVGLILAGGAGRRCGGRDKAWLRLNDRPLLCHALERLAPQVDQIVIASSRHGWAYRRLGLPVQPDREVWRGHGPIAAIATALMSAGPARVAVMPVDAPLAPRDYVRSLHPALDAGARAAAVFDGDRRQPLFALLDGALAGHAAAAAGHFDPPSMHAWLDSVGVEWVLLSGRAGEFVNVNTREQLCQLDQRTRAAAPSSGR